MNGTNARRALATGGAAVFLFSAATAFADDALPGATEGAVVASAATGSALVAESETTRPSAEEVNAASVAVRSATNAALESEQETVATAPADADATTDVGVSAVSAAQTKAAVLGIAKGEPVVVAMASDAVPDRDLDALRGRYAPEAVRAPLSIPASQTSVPSTASSPLAPDAFSNNALSRAVSSAAFTNTLAGSVTGLGVTLASGWQTAAGDSYAAGLNLTLDPSMSSAPTLNTWSTHTAASGPASVLAAINNVTSTPLAVNGIAQTVQIAGDGNAAANHALIALVPSITMPAIPAGPSCGTICKVTTGSGGAAVSLTLPQGIASQAISPGGVMQSVAIGTDGNAVTNMLRLQIATSAMSHLSAGSFLPTNALNFLSMTRR